MHWLRSIFAYGRFFLITGALLFTMLLMVIGGPWLMYFGIAFGALLVLGDLFMGLDEQPYEYPAHAGRIFYPLQYGSEFVCMATIAMLAWTLGLPERDLFGIASAVHWLTGYDVIAAHAANTMGFYITAVIMAGVAGAYASIANGHELTHRTENPTAVFIGRLGQAFAQHTHFSIRHPYGHHNLVCTPADPATARRGENFYHFMVRSIIGQYKMTWELEQRRMRRMRRSTWSWENKALRGWGMQVLVVAMFIYAAGWLGLLGIILVGAISHLALELANYIEHYGLVRLHDQPQQIRHAWNDNHKVSLWFAVGIPRHAHHHADASVEFWELQPVVNEAPQTPLGYLGSWILCLIPPVWFDIIAPRLLEWDEKFATDEERELAMQQNLKSGIPLLVRAAEEYYARQGHAPQHPAQPSIGLRPAAA